MPPQTLKETTLKVAVSARGSVAPGGCPHLLVLDVSPDFDFITRHSADENPGPPAHCSIDNSEAVAGSRRYKAAVAGFGM